jgi:hypothetical protein
MIRVEKIVLRQRPKEVKGGEDEPFACSLNDAPFCYRENHPPLSPLPFDIL